MSVLFIHYEVAPAVLQPAVPFELDVREGKAYVSLVAFTQERLRFEFGGRLTAWVGALTANHSFLNLRTYVRVANEPGIFFLAEWVPNRLAAWIAPLMFGLPYRLGRLDYQHDTTRGVAAGEVRAAHGRFRYRGHCTLNRTIVQFNVQCRPGSLDEFLLERYVAFTERHGRKRFFRVAHEPWPQARVNVTVEDDSLLDESFAWWPQAQFAAANFSPGVTEVRIGRPRRLEEL